MICCGDIELIPDPEMCYEYFFKVSEMYKNNLRFVYLNFQDVYKKHMLLKTFISDMGKNAVNGIAPSERDDLNLFVNSAFESLWVEWRKNVSKTSSLEYS